MTQNELDIEKIIQSQCKLKKSVQNGIKLIGEICIDVLVNDCHISDEYFVEILIPDNYPQQLPAIKELGNRIKKYYRHIYPNRMLCLATDSDIRIKLIPEYSLYNWFDSFVIPYFVTYSYYEKYGVFPFGERPHGVKGEFEYLAELFEINNEHAIKQILDYIVNKKYRGHNYCPCGSGKRIRNCHKELVLKYQNEQYRSIFNDALNMIKGDSF